MTNSEIKKLINRFLSKRKPKTRYTSFDYCFNYFGACNNRGRLRHLVAGKNLEISCLHLGFFLASWGMFRMSGRLGREVNAKHFRRLLTEISQWSGKHRCARIWEIDVPHYADPEIRKFLFERYKKIKSLVKLSGQKSYRTLATKIMLGMFGCVPAFDSYFTETFHVSKFSPDALLKIHSFYWEHEDIIDKFAKRTKTFSFQTGRPTTLQYNRAKIVDMVGFQKGKNRADAKKRRDKTEKRKRGEAARRRKR